MVRAATLRDDGARSVGGLVRARNRGDGGGRRLGLRSWETVIVLLWILGLLLSGLIVGALGRLVIPGPNPMSIGMTLVVGIGGSLLGGLVGALLLGRPGGLLLAVAGAALIVWLIERGRREGVQRPS